MIQIIKFFRGDKNKAANEDTPLTPKTEQEVHDTNSHATTSTSHHFLGYLLLVTASIFVTLGLSFCQGLNQSVPHFQLTGIRFVAHALVAISLVIGISKKKTFSVILHNESKMWTAVACFLFTAENYAFYGASYYLPLGVSGGIPAALILIINYVISGIQRRGIHWYELTSIIVCIPGIFMICQPPLLFKTLKDPLWTLNVTFQSPCGQHLNNTPEDGSANWTDPSRTYHISKHTIIGYIFAMSTPVLYTLYMKLIQTKLTDIDFLTVNFWIAFGGSALSFVIMAITETPTWPSEKLCVFFILGHSFFAGSCGCLIYKSIQLLPSEIVALLQTLDLPLLVFLQYTFMAGTLPGYRNAVEISGSIMVIAAVTFVPAYETILLRRK